MSIGRLLLACLIALPAVAEEPSVNSTGIHDGLHLLQGRGGNVLASVGADGVLLVDSDYANYAPAYQAAIEKLGNNQAKYVVNTHWHGDHTGGDAFWGERGSTIVAHENVRVRMSTRQENKFFGRVTEPSPVAAWPQVTFNDSLALHFNGDTVEIKHYPTGHTDGDSVVFFLNANVVHMGDHYFKERFPFVDLASGGNVDGFIRNVEDVLGTVDNETVIVPGHGSLANRADLERYVGMLKDTRAEVRTLQQRGMSLEEIQAQGLDEKWESWGSGFINEANWIAFIFASR